ncbi:MAG: PHP domain-containing protein [Defluviitaleaceae bacterium]|nr:PHP domain-containing protein [Defluviitaleaceae bacterium]MCL2836218.1 PHP domain-containing protein [Defluviitaleaceae bacterium]
MHTSPVSACAGASPAAQVHAYKKRGYAGIIVTDHFINGNSSCPPNLPWIKKMAYIASGYHEAKKAGDKCGVDVFFGWEFCIDGSDFLTYGLTLDFLLANPGLDRLNIEQYSVLVRRNGGYICQAHPFRKAWWIPNQFPMEPHLLDAVEIYNASDQDKTNDKARDFAAFHNLPMQAGSDSHYVNIPFTSGIMLDKKAESIFDIIAAIKSGAAKLIVP